MVANIDSDLIQFLQYRLHLGEKAQIIRDQIERGIDPIFKPDLLIVDSRRIFFIIMKRRFSFSDLARLHFLSDFAHRKSTELLRYLGIKDGDNISIIGITIHLRPEIDEYASSRDLDITTIPPELYSNLHPSRRSPLPKLSSESSFKVILSILKLRSSTILEISKHSGISYPWTHGVITRLIQIGGVTRRTGFVTVGNLDAILDAISYERPFRSLIYREISVEMNDALEMSTKITAMSEKLNIHPVFTYLTAASVRDRINIRRDVAYVYLSKSESTALSDIISISDKGKLKLTLLLPDREILENSKELMGIKVASDEQTILDLISGGIPTRDVAMRMIDRYVSKQDRK